VTIPEKPVVGDLLIPASDIGDYKAGKVYKYNGSSWVEIKYTDDTRAEAAYTLADGAKSVADNAQTIGDNLVNGLGFKKSEVADNYIISPVIAGGTLLIGDTNGTYAQITKEGILNAKGANITGKITATEGYIGTKEAGFTINSSYFSSGRDSYKGDGDGVYIGTDGIALGMAHITPSGMS
jgi:hypothetical protein